MPAGAPNEVDAADRADYERYHAAMDGREGYLPHLALQAVWLTVARANEYVDRQAPWKLAKDPARRAELEATLATLVRQLARHAVHLLPFMPARCEALWVQLGAPGRAADQTFATLERLDVTGWTVAKGDALFPKEGVAKSL